MQSWLFNQAIPAIPVQLIVQLLHPAMGQQMLQEFPDPQELHRTNLLLRNDDALLQRQQQQRHLFYFLIDTETRVVPVPACTQT